MSEGRVTTGQILSGFQKVYQNNPYIILGLTTTSSRMDADTRMEEITDYAEIAGKSKSYPIGDL